MAQRRPQPLPGKTANSFLEAAQTQVARNGNREEDTAAAEKRQEEQARKYADRQAEFYAAHMAPLLKQLLDLPERKGRLFTMESRFSLMRAEKPSLFVSLYYRGKPGPMLPTSDGLLMIMDDYIDENRFAMRLVRLDKYNPQNDKEKLTIHVIADVKLLQAELGKFVADVAPDRVAELAAPQKPATKPRAPQPK